MAIFGDDQLRKGTPESYWYAGSLRNPADPGDELHDGAALDHGNHRALYSGKAEAGAFSLDRFRSHHRAHHLYKGEGLLSRSCLSVDVRSRSGGV